MTQKETHTGQTLVAGSKKNWDKNSKPTSKKTEKTPWKLEVYVGTTKMIGEDYQRTVSDTWFLEEDKKKFTEYLSRKKFLQEAGFEVRASEVD